MARGGREGGRAFVQALNLLADRGEAQSIYLMQTDPASGLTDHEKADEQAEAVGGEDRHYLFGYCAARARRIVGVQAALIVALVPEVVSRPVVTGEKLEALIQELST